MFQGVEELSVHNQVRVHEISTARMTVREYVNADGTIFAVTWKGWSEPDLDQLLGPYAKAVRREQSPKAISRAVISF